MPAMGSDVERVWSGGNRDRAFEEFYLLFRRIDCSLFVDDDLLFPSADYASAIVRGRVIGKSDNVHVYWHAIASASPFTDEVRVKFTCAGVIRLDSGDFTYSVSMPEKATNDPWVSLTDAIEREIETMAGQLNQFIRTLDGLF